MATIKEILEKKSTPRPTLKICDKCGYEYYFSHDCKKALEKEKSPAEKLKEKFNRKEERKNGKR